MVRVYLLGMSTMTKQHFTMDLPHFIISDTFGPAEWSMMCLHRVVQ